MHSIEIVMQMPVVYYELAEFIIFELCAIYPEDIGTASIQNLSFASVLKLESTCI